MSDARTEIISPFLSPSQPLRRNLNDWAWTCPLDLFIYIQHLVLLEHHHPEIKVGPAGKYKCQVMPKLNILTNYFTLIQTYFLQQSSYHYYSLLPYNIYSLLHITTYYYINKYITSHCYTNHKYSLLPITSSLLHHYYTITTPLLHHYYEIQIYYFSLLR